MTRALGILVHLVLLVTLAGCGEGHGHDGGVQRHPTPATEVALLSATAAGGQATEHLTRLADDAAVAAYARQFRGTLPHQIRDAAAATTVPAGEELAAAVVAVGCDRPTQVVAQDGDRVHAVVPDSGRECLAPETTVALFLVPQ